jgi:hypothetical protein
MHTIRLLAQRSRVAPRARAVPLVSILVLALVLGCNPRPKDSVLQTSAADWKSRYEEERTRRLTMESQVLTALNQNLQQIRRELEQVHLQLPGAFHEDLRTQLTATEGGISKKLDHLEQKASRLAGQLDTRMQELHSAQDTLTRKLEAIRKDQALSQTQITRDDLSGLMKEVGHFDQMRLLCRDCPESIRLDSHARDALLTLHKMIFDRLSQAVNRLNGRGAS